MQVEHTLRNVHYEVAPLILALYVFEVFSGLNCNMFCSKSHQCVSIAFLPAGKTPSLLAGTFLFPPCFDSVWTAITRRIVFPYSLELEEQLQTLRPIHYNVQSTRFGVFFCGYCSLTPRQLWVGRAVNDETRLHTWSCGPVLPGICLCI